MTRLWRLMAPALSFVLVGSLLLLAWQEHWAFLRGGLLTAALWALATQVVASVLVVSAIDDLRSGAPWVGRGRGARRGSMREISSRPTRLRPTLREFYLTPFVPAALLAYGLGLTLSGVAEGAVGSESQFDTPVQGVTTNSGEVILGVLFGFGALAYLVRGGLLGYAGFVLGFAGAVVVGQIVFGTETNADITVRAWGSAAIGICVGGVGFKQLWRLVAVRRLTAHA